MTGKPLIITTSLITLLAAAMQVEARDGNTGEGLIPAENYFDGAPLNNKRARRIAQRAGDRFLAVKQCMDGRNKGIRGCIDLSVEKNNGRRFDYRVSDRTCSADSLSGQRPNSSTNTSAGKQGVGIRGTNAKARCYDKYTVLFRAKRKVNLTLRKHGVSLYSNASLQVPALAGENRWLTIGNMERSTTINKLPGIQATMDWRLEVSDGPGTVLDFATGSETITSLRSKADTAHSRKPLPAIPPGKKNQCKLGARTVESGFNTIADKAIQLCTTTSFGLENFDIRYFSSRDENRPYSGLASGSVCKMLVGDNQQKGSVVAGAYLAYCMDDGPPPVDPPDEPPEVPPVKEPMEPACPPGGSNIPEVTILFDIDIEGVSYTCDVMTRETCGTDEETNTCSCETVQVGQPICTERQDEGPPIL